MFSIKNKFLLIMMVLFTTVSTYVFSSEFDQIIPEHSNNYFTENKGQWEHSVLLLTKSPNLNTWVRNNRITLDYYQEVIIENTDPKLSLEDDNTIRKGHVIEIFFKGANKDFSVIKNDPLDTYLNFFLGNDKEKWQSKVKLYQNAVLQDIYDKIDMNLYFEDKNMRYDFIVAPKGNPNQIQLEFDGADQTYIGDKGDLVIVTSIGDLVQSGLYTYQIIKGEKIEINSKFKRIAQNIYGFEFGDYDQSYPLIIDPLIYSTYFGGSGNDFVADANIDSDGNIYISGRTRSANLPTSTGAYETSANGLDDLYVTKLNDDGSDVVYSSYIGGSFSEEVAQIYVDDNGYLYLVGSSRSSNFPTSANAFQRSIGASFYYDAVIVKFNTDGTDIEFSTYLGGSDNDKGYGIHVDEDGNASITGTTESTNFDVVSGGYQTSLAGESDGFLVKLNSTASDLVFGTYLGGTDDEEFRDIAVDNNDYIYLTGYTESDDFPVSIGAYQTTLEGSKDSFIAKLNSSASSLSYCTYIGGSFDDKPNAIALDGNEPIITGYTQSRNYPTTTGVFQSSNNGIYNAFITRLNANGSSLEYSTFIGGNSSDYGNDLLLDSDSNVFLCGTANSNNFPVTDNALQSTKDANNDAFIFKLSSDGTTNLYSTYLGGDAYDEGQAICFDGNITVFLAGHTSSSDFPTTSGVYATTNPGSTSAFVSKMSLGIENPELTYPFDESVAVALNTTFSWTSVDGANSYDIEFSTVSDFSTIADTESDIAQTSYQSDDLQDETVYYWHVRANSDDFTSTWSESWSFSTPGLVPTPELVFPSDDSFGISVESVVLDWDEAETATSYTLQISDDDTFSTTIINEENTTNTSYTFTSLTYGQKYYWRVLAKNDEDISGWSEVWAFTSELDAVTLDTPEDDTYNVNSDPVTFSWDPLYGALDYDLFIATNSDYSEGLIAENSISATSQTVTLEDGMKYWWKVRGNNAGEQGPWSESYQFYTRLIPPELLSPVNNALSVSISPTFEWQQVVAASSYDFQLSGEDDFSPLIHSENGITGTSLEYSTLEFGEQYFWRVRSRNSSGVTVWSETWTFIVDLGPITLLSPADNSAGVPIDVTEFTWQALAGSDAYDIIIASDESFTQDLISSNDMTATSFTVTGLDNGKEYWWKVRGKNSEDTGPWAEPFSFYTKLLPPELSQPNDDIMNMDLSVTLEWLQQDGAEMYDVQLSLFEDFSEILQTSSDIDALELTLTDLSYNTEYFWRVRSTRTGDASDWSDPFRFTTKLEPPTLVTPSEGSTGQLLTIDMIWTSDDETNWYSFQLSDDLGFSNLIFDVENITEETYQVTGLTNGKLYYWRVKAFNTDQYSEWSEPFSFHTYLEPPVLVSPADPTYDVALATTLDWNASVGAGWYNLEYSTTDDFSDGVMSYTYISETEQDINGLSYGTQYYWRVQSENSYEASVWSVPFTFHTIMDTPVLIAPEDGMAGQLENIEFSWNGINAADSYTIEFSEFEDFSVNSLYEL
jgi:hypothetical protein